MKRIRLAILYGGRSAEHQVSVVSARSVMEALDPERFEVVPIAITRDGAWLLPDRSPLELTASDGTLPEVEAAGRELAVRPEEGVGGGDVVFPILHGPLGEDGTVQGLFELADLPYVGSGVLASALAMDKAMAKVVLAQAGLPQGPYLVVPERDWEATPERVVAEVIPSHEFYDFEAKYLDDALKLEIPAQVPEGVRAQVRELSLRAFQALDCEGFARVDFFYEEATGRVLLNEVNTIPGFTPKSMFPMLWAASGLAYPDLVARLVDLAVERHAARRR